MLPFCRQGARPSCHLRVHVSPDEEAKIIKEALESFPRCKEPDCSGPSTTVILAPDGEVLFVLCRQCAPKHAQHDSLVMKVRS